MSSVPAASYLEGRSGSRQTPVSHRTMVGPGDTEAAQEVISLAIKDTIKRELIETLKDEKQ